MLNLASEAEAVQHTKATRNAQSSQCILAGSFVEKGTGEIEPYIDPNACAKGLTVCKFCDQTMEIGDWKDHIRRDCQKVPCLLCLESLTDATSWYAKLRLPRRQTFSQMHCQSIFKEVNELPECPYTYGTFNAALLHMQMPTWGHQVAYQSLQKFVKHINCMAVEEPLRLLTNGSGFTVASKSPRISSPLVNISSKQVPMITAAPTSPKDTPPNVKKKNKKRKKAKVCNSAKKVTSNKTKETKTKKRIKCKVKATTTGGSIKENKNADTEKIKKTKKKKSHKDKAGRHVDVATRKANPKVKVTGKRKRTRKDNIVKDNGDKRTIKKLKMTTHKTSFKTSKTIVKESETLTEVIDFAET